MSEPLPARIAEATAYVIKLIRWAGNGEHTPEDYDEAERHVLFLADQLARAHADASKMRTVIEAARNSMFGWHRYPDPGDNCPYGQCAGCDLARALADFDRGEQG